MALSINTTEADQLARSLAQLTGETMTQAVTVALRERHARETSRRVPDTDLYTRFAPLPARVRAEYDTRPVSKAEWDAACEVDECRRRFVGSRRHVLR